VCKYVEGFHVAQDKDQCQVLVNAVMNLWFHKGGEFLGLLRDDQLRKKEGAP
jgi:hypothetical protein